MQGTKLEPIQAGRVQKCAKMKIQQPKHGAKRYDTKVPAQASFAAFIVDRCNHLRESIKAQRDQNSKQCLKNDVVFAKNRVSHRVSHTPNKNQRPTDESAARSQASQH